MSFAASPSPERSSSISDVEAILNYKFKDPKLLEQALTHPSVPYTPSYERLEFLGDRVVNLVVGDHLFQAYPDLDQGELTDLMKANVSNENLARVALRRGLYPFLRHTMQNSDDQVSEFARAVEEEDGGSVEAPKFLADIVESVAAAIYYDVGSKLKRFWKIFKGLLGPILGPESVNHGFDGPLEIEKAKQELDKLCAQKKWHKPNYKAVELDPQQSKEYVCTVEVDTGDGVPHSVKGEKRSSKREAERCAAYRMLLALKNQAQKRQRDKEMLSPTFLPSPSPERGPSVSKVEAILCYKFEDPKLLEQALTHSSIPDAPSYERLEFVGDRVLNLAVSDHLVQAYPELDQGQLSTLLLANVCNEKLARVALRCKLYKFLSHKMQYSNGQLFLQVSEFARAVEEENGVSVEAPKFLADIVKSVVAAIYYDVGSKLKRFWKIFKGLLEPLGPEELQQQQPEPVNQGFNGPLEIKEAKKKLHNLCGKKKWPFPNYKREVLDPQQSKEYAFTVEVVTGDGVPRSVKGEKRSSKREAERCAAYLMLLALNQSNNL